MNQERLDILNEYVKIGMSPILIKDGSTFDFKNSVIINNDIKKEDLNGHYEGTSFCPPSWYNELIKESNKKYCILVIKDINKIPLEEQTKFIEILKYKKISTFTLPSNCIIIATCTDLKNYKISEEVYSLLAEI